MSDYNPYTKPVWLMVMPLALGVVVVAGVVILARMGLIGFTNYMAELEQMAGQFIGC